MAKRHFDERGYPVLPLICNEICSYVSRLCFRRRKGWKFYDVIDPGQEDVHSSRNRRI